MIARSVDLCWDVLQDSLDGVSRRVIDCFMMIWISCWMAKGLKRVRLSISSCFSFELPMADLADEVKNQVEEGLQAAFAENPAAFGAALCVLITEPKHYRALSRLLSNQAALKGYVLQMLEPPNTQSQDNPPLSEDEAEAMLTECKDRFGTELLRMEEAGIVSLSMQTALKRSSATFFVAGRAASAVFAQQASQAAARAVAMHLTSDICKIYSYVAPDLAQSLLAKLASDGLKMAGNAEKQLALRAEALANGSKMVARAGVVLQVGIMGYEFYTNIRKYYKGEIDGYTLAENMTSVAVTTGASTAGAAGATMLCAGAGPVGLIFAGVAGGILAAAFSDFVLRGAFQGLWLCF